MENNYKKGIGASSGIAIAKAFLIVKPEFKISNAKNSNIELEIKLMQDGFAKTKSQIEVIKGLTLQKMGEEKAAIFDAHIQILEDPTLIEEIKNKIKNENENVVFAIEQVYQASKSLFEQMDDAYFKERAADVNDVRMRLLANLLNVQLPDILAINTEVIIVANDLTPSETALLDKKFVKGFLVDIGGRTSHAAIMARTMEIPAVLGLEDITLNVKNGDLIAMNGDSGVVEINPININHWTLALEKSIKIQKELKIFATEKAMTKDGKAILIEANIGKPSDADNLEEYGVEGIGLYRSEFLYMENSKWPTEEEQFQAYKYVLEKQKNHLTVVRTLDIGGDKNLPYYNFAPEMNPFLGHRAIRFCLNHKDIFRTQIRALARASVYGNLGIMFPMIATLEEFQEAKAFTLKTFAELVHEGIMISNKIQIGMMIEIPSSALLVDHLANYADFFSIGTNDLIQYTFAVDRMSSKVKYLYQPNNPALLRLIKNVIHGTKGKKAWVGMCGEMAGDLLSIPILLGLDNQGLDALSMSASSIPKAKYIISKLNSQDCYELANQALQLATEDEVNQLVKAFLKANDIDLDVI